MNIIISTLFQGLLYAILALGVYITFRVLNFADMTSEGSFTLGGSVCAVMISNGFNPIISLVLAGFIGSLAGLFTGILNTKFKIQDILSGILAMIALYSINLRIMGKSNVSLLGKDTVFKMLGNSNISDLIVGIILCLLLLVSMYLFFKTQIGLSVRATGDNEQMAQALGINTNLNKTLALMISGFVCALFGALIVQNQGYSDINMGTGVIVVALASIVIGEAVIKKDMFIVRLISVVVGAIAYKFIIFFVLNLGMDPSNLKLFTSAIVIILLCIQNLRKKIYKQGRNK